MLIDIASILLLFFFYIYQYLFLSILIMLYKILPKISVRLLTVFGDVSVLAPDSRAGSGTLIGSHMHLSALIVVIIRRSCVCLLC